MSTMCREELQPSSSSSDGLCVAADCVLHDKIIAIDVLSDVYCT